MGIVGNVNNPATADGYTDPPVTAQQRTPPPGLPLETLLHRTGREVIGSLPALGATVGGALTAPGVATTPIGAAVGAGVGEAVRQTMLHWFPTMGEAPKETSSALMETGKQMLFGGATEVAGPYIDNLFKMAAPALKRGARKSLVAVMQPIDKYSRGHALEAGDQMLKGPGFGSKGYVSLTRGGLEKKAAKGIATVGPEIERREAPIAQKQIDPALIQELNQSLDNLNNSYFMPAQTVPGAAAPVVQPKYSNEPHIQALANIREHLENEMPSVNAAGEIVPGAGNLSRGSLRLVRQNVDNAVRRSEGFARQAMVRGGAVEPALASQLEVERDAADVFRKILNKDEPDIAKLNAEYHLWSNVRDAMSPATLQKEFTKESSPWQQLWHNRMMVWMAQAGATEAANHYIGTQAAEVTGAVFAISQLITSTAWRTVSAATKNKMADMLAKGQLEEVAKLATRVALQRNTTLPPPGAKEGQNKPKTVKMKAPDGSTRDVPLDKVDNLKAHGAVVVQ